MGMSKTPAEQARIDKEKTKLNPVKSFATMTVEERQKLAEEIEKVERSDARRRAAKAAKGGKY
jgi:hypothetical protein